jgi:hypothetical protein
MRPLAEVGRALLMIVVLSAEAAIGVFGPGLGVADNGVLSQRGQRLDESWASEPYPPKPLKFPNPNNQGTEAI